METGIETTGVNMDAAVIATLVALISAFGSLMIGLLLYVLKSFGDRFDGMDKRIDSNTGRINCLEKKLIKVATLFAVAHPEIGKRKNPTKMPIEMRKDETVTEYIERWMKMD